MESAALKWCRKEKVSRCVPGWLVVRASSLAVCCGENGTTRGRIRTSSLTAPAGWRRICALAGKSANTPLTLRDLVTLHIKNRAGQAQASWSPAGCGPLPLPIATFPSVLVQPAAALHPPLRLVGLGPGPGIVHARAGMQADLNNQLGQA